MSIILSQCTLEGPKKYMCVCAGHFLPTGGLPREYDSPLICREPSGRESSSSYNISPTSFNTRHEDRPLQHIPRVQRSNGHNTNNNQPPPRMGYVPRFEPLSNSDLDTLTSLNQLRKSMKQIEILFVNKEKEARRLRKMRREWKSVAIVMDRLFFILYLAIIVTSITLMFPRP